MEIDRTKFRAKVKGLKAESGANQVALSWKIAKNSISYKIYQNGTLPILCRAS